MKAICCLSITISLLIGGIIGRASSDFRLVSGLVTANDVEITNCQFALAQQTAIMFEPNSIPCDRMKTLVGKKVDMWFTIVE